MLNTNRRIHSTHPLLIETPLNSLNETVTPNSDFFIRNHFEIPTNDSGTWSIRVFGKVAQPIEISIDFLKEFRFIRRRVTLECAGNGRGFSKDALDGVQWGYGGVSTAVFGGVLLRDLLRTTKPDTDSVEVLCSGADRGIVDGIQTQYQRSIPYSLAISDGPILAWEMNEQLLSAEHGAPLRLVVPGWYGMASVKWLTELEVLSEPFHGYFQRDRYVYVDAHGTAIPVSRILPRSVITSPAEGATLQTGQITVSGVAWSASPIAGVDVSTDDGNTWRPAVLLGQDTEAMVSWHYESMPASPGKFGIRSRAYDTSGDLQPPVAPANVYGYGNNSIQNITVNIATGSHVHLQTHERLGGTSHD